MEYQMYRTCARFIFKYSPFSPFSPVFFVAIVTNIKMTKIDTNIWFLLFKTLNGIIAFSFTEKTFNMEKVFFFSFNNDIDICYKRVLIITLLLFTIVPKTFLVVLVIFIGLVGKKLLLSTRYISKGDVSQLIFSRIIIFFLSLLSSSKALGINLLQVR